jgi:hypothetical protein
MTQEHDLDLLLPLRAKTKHDELEQTPQRPIQKRHDQPELFSEPNYAVQLREAVVAAVTVSADEATGMRRRPRLDVDTPTMATAATTLKTRLSIEDAPLSAPERALMDQWLTTPADAPTAARATRRRRPQRIRKKGSR